MMLKNLLILLVLFNSSIHIKAEYKSYRNYKVFKIIPTTEKDIQVLLDVQKDIEYIFWTDIFKIGDDVKVMVGPEKQKEFEEYMVNVGLKANIIIEDVQQLIVAQLNSTEKVQRNNNNGEEYAWNRYQELEEIHDWLNETAIKYPDVVSLVTIGRSVEGREIRGVIINFKKKDNPTIGMIEGGIHAREWISPATVTWIIKEFLTSTHPDVRFMAENVVWHIFPVVNPDGYLYTFTHNRMWRKNRNPSNFITCVNDDDMSRGIDLNRNFGFHWMTVGASSNPCAETYAGPIAFSEPETMAIANYVSTIQQQGNLVYYFAFHSFSQMVLVPYSHVSGAGVLEAPNYGDMYEIAIKGMDKLKERHGTDYIVGTSADILYEVSGSSFDWVKGEAHVPIVYLFELRDVGEFGFLLPPSLIIPNSEEMMDGLVEMDKVTRQLEYYYSSGNVSKFSAISLLLTIYLLINI